MIAGVDRNTLARYLTVAAIIVVVGGLFVQRELLSDGEPASTAAASLPSGSTLGLFASGSPDVGSPAPDFVLETSDGLIRLSDFRGKTVIVNFWASWCAPCRAEMPEFQALYEQRLEAGDLQVIAIDFTPQDTREAALAFADEIGLTFPIAFDTSGGDVAEGFGVFGLPATFFIDAEGVLRAKNLGPVFGDLLPNGVAAADAGGAG